MELNIGKRRTPESPVEIRGERVRLRTLTPADADGAYVGWMNDPDIVRFTESRFSSYSVTDIRAYIATVLESGHSLFLAIEAQGRHIGNIKLGPIDWNHRSADIGLIIGDKACWGKGYGSEAIGSLSDYAFSTLGLHKLLAGVYAPNVGCMKAFMKAGYLEEGCLRRQCRLEQDWVDVVLLGRASENVH